MHVMSTTDLDQLMDRASHVLVKMQYLEAEKLCEQALLMAYECKFWGYLARITLPLQECRRQRRMYAADGEIVIGTGHLPGDVVGELDQIQCGCVVFTGDDAKAHAIDLLQRVADKPRYLLVFFASVGNDQWQVHSASKPEFYVNYSPPPEVWQNVNQAAGEYVKASDSAWPTPGDWVLDVQEKLGDQALKVIDTNVDALQRVDALLEAITAVPDHEILHQQLAKTATNMVVLT